MMDSTSELMTEPSTNAPMRDATIVLLVPAMPVSRDHYKEADHSEHHRDPKRGVRDEQWCTQPFQLRVFLERRVVDTELGLSTRAEVSFMFKRVHGS